MEVSRSIADMNKILIVDDDEDLCELLIEFLGSEGYTCQAEHDGSSGERRILQEDFDLVILDIMLPGKNGLEILQSIRQKDTEVPVLMLTARGEENDRIEGLELGSDDYLAKPFNPRELLARIRAILRRLKTNRANEKAVLEAGGIKLDPFSRSVYIDGDLRKLTSLEFDFLEALMKRAGETVPRETLSREVLEREFSPLDRSIDVHIVQLRRKLGSLENGEPRIKTVRGIGYILGFEKS